MRLGVDRNSNAFVVILQELEGDRILPIWIGQSEAESIVIEMHKIHRARPLTHDLCGSIISNLGGVLSHVHITRVESRTYFAEMFIERDEDLFVVDARPSDAIAIAIRVDAPIMVNTELLTDATIDEIESQSASETGTQLPMTPDQLKAYLEALHPEDFGKFNP